MFGFGTSTVYYLYKCVSEFLQQYCSVLMYADTAQSSKESPQALVVDAYALNCHSITVLLMIFVNKKKSNQLIFESTIDTDVSWNAQVGDVCRKIASRK